jgi:hypothetical protein
MRRVNTDAENFAVYFLFRKLLNLEYYLILFLKKFNVREISDVSVTKYCNADDKALLGNDPTSEA